MMELNNLLKSLDIDKDYHDKIFDNMILHMTEKWCACSAPSVYL